MDEKEREYTLDRLRFFLQHTPSREFNVEANLNALMEIVEEEGPLKMAALQQVVSIRELTGTNRGKLIEDIIDLAKTGVQCCQDPRCPVDLLIDVAIATLAEGKQKS